MADRVSVFDARAKLRASLERPCRPAESEPNGASGIAIDANDTLYVTDSLSHKFATSPRWDVSGQLGRLGSGTTNWIRPGPHRG